MYLHLGQEIVIRQKDLIGIFDIETSTVSKNTKEFLAKSEKNHRVVTVSEDLPKTFIVCKGKKEKISTVYISQISAQTLLKRTHASLGSNYRKF